ncbi:MAG: pantothenate synthase [Alyxoria varia]|nr:MAG: pantothenate synthase [Alyxoria varia]
MSDPGHAPFLIHGIDELRAKRENRGSVGLVPTMGALHEGHLSLCKTAARENDLVFMSLFVNPTQFGRGEDLESYPRTLEDDMEKIRRLNVELSSEQTGDKARDTKPCVHYVFAPNSRSMYPNHPPSSEPDAAGTFVNVRPLSSVLEGRTRPHFFRGVATVVAKLLNIVQPTRVYFGQKDAQQCAVIAQMVDDLHFNTNIRVLPTVREHDGLAMSSRNTYLGGAESERRQAATVLYDRLTACKARYEKGAVTRQEILGGDADPTSYKEKTFHSGRVPWMLDYVSLADRFTMQEVDERVRERGAIVSAALWMLPFEEGIPEREKRNANSGSKDDHEDPTRVVRLIDNIILPPRNETNYMRMC